MIGKIGISASYNTMYLYTSEIFPTEIRSLGLGICDFAGYVACVVAPYSRLSVSITLHNYRNKSETFTPNPMVNLSGQVVLFVR